MDINDLMKKAQGLQEKMQEMQDSAVKATVTGESGAGMICVEMNGKYEARNIKIDPSLLREDKELLEDLIVAAVNDAVKKVEEVQKNNISGLTGGMQMPPGFKMPF
ncbi:MAG: DNA-binding YbaB/EbfC family protein [Saprospiraceae bacterium]|jgi:DNA-binding YbaB/EbfC family protein|tara:strand:- start:112 stop:429 length:318 start_codon:yes stop_codon:yes gene_type:complete